MPDITQIQVGSTTYDIRDTNVALKAPLASPALTGTPTAPTAADGTNTTQIATTQFVHNAFKANDAMVFKGTIGSSGATVTTLPTTHYQGWTYKVATAGSYIGTTCEVGDMIICITDGTSANNAHWTVVQSNIDGAVTGPASATDTHIATFNGTSGKIIKDSGFTIATSVPANAKFTDTKYTATTTSIGSAATGTAIKADDITSWSTGTLPTLGTAIKADDITAWSTGTLPTLGTAIPADDITAWSTGTLASATVQNENLIINFGTLPSLSYTAKTIPNVTAVGTLPSLSYSEKTIPNVTAVGTLPSLQYSEKTIPNITVSSKTVITGITEG